MPKKRCAYCRQYGQRSEMLQVGLYTFCDEDHRRLHRLESQKKTTKRNRAAKSDPSPETRDYVMKADGGMCRMCGARNDDLVVHHITYRSEESDPEILHSANNLITLCNYPCHLVRVHGNKKKYKPLCMYIVFLREIRNDSTTTIEALLELESYGF